MHALRMQHVLPMTACGQCSGCRRGPCMICVQGMTMWCRGIPCEEWTQYADVANETGASYNVSFYFPVSQVSVLQNNHMPPM